MNKLLAILLLLCLAWPGAEWSRAVEGISCAEAFTESSCHADQATTNCGCCEAGSCACAAQDTEEPSSPLPALPPRPVSSGDLFFPLPEVSFLLPSPERQATVSKSWHGGGLSLAASQAVPFYLKHCSLLW